jgi:hypothetical protein
LPAVSEEVSTFEDRPAFLRWHHERDNISALSDEARRRHAEGRLAHDHQYVELKKGTGEIVLPFTGGEVNLVVCNRGHLPLRQRSTDGQPVGDSRGTDVGTDGIARFDQLRDDSPGRPSAAATSRADALSSSDAGVRAYVFTFGP